MEFSHVQLSRIAAVAAVVTGKDKEAKLNDDEKLEKDRLHNAYITAVRQHQKAQTADKPEHGFMA